MEVYICVRSLVWHGRLPRLRLKPPAGLGSSSSGATKIEPSSRRSTVGPSVLALVIAPHWPTPQAAIPQRLRRATLVLGV